MTFCLHAAIDFFRNLLGKINATDPRVNHGNAKFSGLAIGLLLNRNNEAGTIVTHNLLLISFAQHPAHSRIKHRGKLIIRPGYAVDRLIETQWVNNSIANEAVDLEPLIV